MQLAKLIPVLKEAARNSVGIERHDNRYFFDSDTVYFDNLLGGYIDGKYLVPVRFGLKHSRTGNTVLYVVIDQNKIPLSSLAEIKKTEVVKTPALQTQTPEASRSVTYSVAQIIEFVNSGDVLRYIPDEMLTEAQKITKYEAIAKTIEKTNIKNDERYIEFIKSGNLWEAARMVLAAARSNGYNSPVVMHGTYDARIVDRYGQPHDGTVFTIFDSSKSRADEKDGSAYFFTDNDKVAGMYAQKSEFADENRYYYSEPKVYNAYLKLGKTYTVDAKGNAWNVVPIPEGCTPKTYNGKTTSTQDSKRGRNVRFKMSIKSLENSLTGATLAKYTLEEMKSMRRIAM